MDGQTPKKQRKDASIGLSPAGSTPSPAQQAQEAGVPQQWVAQTQQPSPVLIQEAGDSNEAALGGTAVTDAAKAFRELRVRATRAVSPHVAGHDGHGSGQAGGGGGGPAAPDRPPSPKKRKASYNIDKEFILKDDKVKRNADTQGDISQARGQLGQLLFEFSQIELNRDLLEAIKRTESKTGRSSGRPPAPPGRLDRAAFEVAVADAAELLQAQLSSVEAHCEDAALRGAILRTYAVQAIAAFADEDSDGDDESDAGGGAAASSSSDDENADSNSRRRMRGGSSSQDDRPPRGLGPGSAPASGSQSLEMPPRPASAAGCHSPPHLPPHLQQGQAAHAHARQQPGTRPAGIHGSPSRSQPAGSAAGQAGSSSFLPDAPPDSALEDTATARGRGDGPAHSGVQDGDGEGVAGECGATPRSGGGGGPGRLAWHTLPAGGEESADEGALQRMRMLSLEAEGSAQQGHSVGDSEDGPQDMVRSPAPVTSRRMPPAKALPLQLLREGLAGAADGGAPEPGAAMPQQERQRRPRVRSSPAGGGAPADPRVAAVLDSAQRLALQGRSLQQQAPQQQQREGDAEQQQESSEGHSTGQASSAAPEPPKRQRRSSEPLPPLYEHSSQQRRQQPHPQRHTGVAAAAAAAASGPASDSAAAAAQRGAAFGSVQPVGRSRQHRLHRLGEPQPPQQQQEQQQHSPAGPPGEGHRAGSNAPGAEQQPGQEGQPEGPAGQASDAALRAPPRAACSGSSVWGSTLVCADLTVNDVASQYWPFLRMAMRGQTAALQEGDRALVASLVASLGDTITDAYAAQAGAGRRPSAEAKSLVAATAFDDFFRAQNAGSESSLG